MNSALDRFERQLVDASRELTRLSETPAPATPIATGPQGTPPWRRGRTRWQPSRPVLSFAAMVVVVGGIATASSLLSPSQRLAQGTVNCFMATHGSWPPAARLGSAKAKAEDHTLAWGGVRANGQPPISFCRAEYRLNHVHLNGSPTGPQVASLPLIACQESRTSVGVYVATGQTDQCQRLGEKPLPNAYASAAARLRGLQHALLTVQHQQPNCPSVSSLVQQVRTVLAEQHFRNWRVIAPQQTGEHSPSRAAIPAGTGGTCAKLYIDGLGGDINTQRQTVSVELGPPRTISRIVNHVLNELVSDSDKHCYTPATIRPLAQRLLAHTTLRPRFATIARQAGVSYAPPSLERHYQQGCVRPILGFPGNNNRFVDIVLNRRGAQRLPGDQLPPARAFHP